MGGITLSLHKYLDEIIEVTGISREIVFDGVSNSRDFSSLDLLKLSENLKVHPLKLYSKELDLSSLGDNCKLKIPDKYNESKYSSTTSLRSILEEYDKNNRAEDALLYLGLDKKLIEQHRAISILSVNDALQFMKGLLNEDNLINIAQRNAEAFLGTEFGLVYQNQLKEDGPVSAFFENTQLIEKNWSYSYKKISDSEFRISTKQSKEMQDEVIGSNYTNDLTNKIRMEFIKHVISLSGFYCNYEQVSEIGKNGLVHFDLKLQHLHQPIHQYQ